MGQRQLSDKFNSRFVNSHWNDFFSSLRIKHSDSVPENFARERERENWMSLGGVKHPKVVHISLNFHYFFFFFFVTKRIEFNNHVTILGSFNKGDFGLSRFSPELYFVTVYQLFRRVITRKEVGFFHFRSSFISRNPTENRKSRSWHEIGRPLWWIREASNCRNHFEPDGLETPEKKMFFFKHFHFQFEARWSNRSEICHLNQWESFRAAFKGRKDPSVQLSKRRSRQRPLHRLNSPNWIWVIDWRTRHNRSSWA
jgi:hypothetical protein